MDDKNRRDDNYDRQRVASDPERTERSDDKSRRADQASRKEPLTRREREERWPVD